jgi:cytochrome d ubiquinol oxidase subunit I
MQTPAGYEIVDGVFHVTSWREVIFNPSMPYRLAHMLLASFLTVAFLMTGVAAWQILRGKDNLATRPVLKAGLVAGAALIPVQIFMGDLHGLNTLEHQPAKIAAMEAIWKTERGAPLVLFALPDAKTQTNRLAVEIPRGAALILTHQVDGELKGIDAFPDAHPPVAPVFFGFRVMVGVGVLMLVASWLGAWHVWRQRRQAAPFALPRWTLVGLTAMTFSGWVATVAGWYVSEIGRQPFLVQGYLRTAEAASTVPPQHIALTLTAYLIVYALLIVAYVSVLRYMAEKPVEDLSKPVRLPGQRPAAATAGAE